MSEIEVPARMQGTQYLHFVIGNGGDVTTEGFNFNGIGCTEASRVFEEALGTVSEREMKSAGDNYQRTGI